jgi:hypothetical protein
MEPKSRGWRDRDGMWRQVRGEREEKRSRGRRSVAFVLRGEICGAVTVDLERTRSGGAGRRDLEPLVESAVRSDEDVTSDELAPSDRDDEDGH